MILRWNPTLQPPCFYGEFILASLILNKTSVSHSINPFVHKYGHPISMVRFLFPVGDRVNRVPLFWDLKLTYLKIAVIIIVVIIIIIPKLKLKEARKGF